MWEGRVSMDVITLTWSLLSTQSTNSDARLSRSVWSIILPTVGRLGGGELGRLRQHTPYHHTTRRTGGRGQYIH